MQVGPTSVLGWHLDGDMCVGNEFDMIPRGSRYLAIEELGLEDHNIYGFGRLSPKSFGIWTFKDVCTGKEILIWYLRSSSSRYMSACMYEPESECLHRYMCI